MLVQRGEARPAGSDGAARARAGRRRGEKQQRQRERDHEHHGGGNDPLEHWAAPCVSFRRTSPAAVRTRCAAHATGTSHQQKGPGNRH